jgi:hypothetical protein
MQRSLGWIVALCTCTSVAHAQGITQEGSLVAVDAEDLILDLGSTRGARAGDIVDLWRPIRVKHPVTGKLIVDRFRIGQLRGFGLGVRGGYGARTYAIGGPSAGTAVSYAF